MKKQNNKIVNEYIKEISKALTCSKDMKTALLHELEQQARELESKVQSLTADDLYNEIGSPQEIALGFESRADIEAIKKNATKYRKAKIICLISSILAVIAVVIAIVIICSNDDYYSDTQVNSTIEEVTS
ncbi:MAG: hypothetical protein IJW00_03810 [Clostridia bacterium]|nr:hypothetical protein [Clostridia bacterium]